MEGIYDRIKSLLLAHTLAPGQLLQIGTLAEELGVSTTPVREALTRLAAERLIVFAPKRGLLREDGIGRRVARAVHAESHIARIGAARVDAGAWSPKRRSKCRRKYSRRCHCLTIPSS